MVSSRELLKDLRFQHIFQAGNVGIDDFLSRLMESVEVYSTHIKDEIQEENERAARDQVKTEQDIAYQEALEIDMAKEEAKQQKERALAAERHRLESEKAEQEAHKEKLRMEVSFLGFWLVCLKWINP